MLESISISKRIGSGFLCVTVILVGLVFFSSRSIANISDGFYTFRDISGQASAISKLVSDVSEARIAVLKYRQDPNDEQRQRVIENFNVAIGNAALIDAFASNPSQQAEVERLITLTEQYQSTFAEISRMLGTANTLSPALFETFSNFQNGVDAIMAAAVASGDSVAIAGAGRILQAAAAPSAQGRALLAANESSSIDAFETSLPNFILALDQLMVLDPPPAVVREVSETQQSLQRFTAGIAEFVAANTRVRNLQTSVLDVIGPQLEQGFGAIATAINAEKQMIAPRISDRVSRLEMVSITVGIFAVGASIICSLIVARWISGSIARLVTVTDRLASGDNDVEIAGAEFNHELGRMAKALNVFRDAQLERKQASEERARQRTEQDTVVKTMQQALKRLAEGDLNAIISTPFAPEYEDLRENFNEAVAALHTAMADVIRATGMIGNTTAQSNAATTELSQRTENQAATLEQTAAALDQLTASIRSAAEHAKSVDTSVKRARSEATKNGEIVSQAVGAMDEIEESSKQITQVIGVIDDIAFQTNLLALNAGVEAARAGDSGKGFAVVASEVRALAQRSAEAAKEISALIANSTRHVQQGTQLVGNAGEALSEIITQVDAIASMTTEIATSAEEQSIGLSEINIGVNQLDQATQQNAAMVQQSISRGGVLAQETNKLNDLVGQFQVSVARPTNGTPAALAMTLEDAINNTHQPDKSPMGPPAHITAKTNTAQAIWEDF